MYKAETEHFFNNIDINSVIGIEIDNEFDSTRIEYGFICMPESTYLENREIVDDLVIKMCTYKRNEHLSYYPLVLISEQHMTNEIFEAIANNESISELILGNHKLTRKEFEILSKNKNIESIDSEIDQSLYGFYDKRLDYLYHTYINHFISYGNVLFDDELKLIGEFDEEQADKINRLLEKRKKDGRIIFYPSKNEEAIKKVIDEIANLKDQNANADKIIMCIDDNTILNTSCFNNKRANSFVKVFSTTDEPMDLNEYVKTNEKILELFGTYFEHKDKLSPLEKLLWIYPIVCTFKKYKLEEDDNDWKSSRFLHKLLFSPYISCVGYTYLLSYMVSEIDVFLCRAAVEENEFNHYLNLTGFKDEKYEVDGLYLLDCTFDNQTNKEYYYLNHFLVPPRKYRRHFKKVYANVFSDIPDCTKERFEELMQDEKSSDLIIQILSNRYQKEEIFKVAFQDEESARNFYLSHKDQLFELFKGIESEEIPFEKIYCALLTVEKLKHPDMSDKEIKEKVELISQIYFERDYKIYGHKKNAKKTLIHEKNNKD